MAMTNHLRTVLAAPLALGLAAVAVAETPSIEQLAPNKTILLMGVNNTQTTMERLKRTSLWELWRSDDLADFRSGLKEQMESGMKEMLDELGLDEESVQPPTGGLGVALFAVQDEETLTPGIGLLLVADYGENADQTAELFDAVMKKGEEDGEVEFEERDIMGRTVRVFELPDTSDGDDMAMGGGMPGMPDPQEMLFGGMKEIYFVREGDAFMLCTDMEALRGAFTVCDDEPYDSLDDRDEFREMNPELGRNDMYAMIMLRDLGPIITANDPMNMLFMVSQLLKQVIGDVKGAAMSARLDGDTAMIEQRFIVYMPNGKTGVTALMTDEKPRGRMPSFVGANATSYSFVSFDMHGLPTALQPVFNMARMFMGPQTQEEEGPTPEEMFAEIASWFGTDHHIVETMDRPVSADSVQQFFALECTKPQEMQDFLSTKGPQMGLEGRDFLGTMIFTVELGEMFGMPGGAPGMDMGAPESMSVGFAGGYAFVGPTPSVEQALRASGEGDAASLADEAMFQRAVAALGGDPAVAWGYSDTVSLLEGEAATVKARLEAQKAEMEELAREYPDMAEEFRQTDEMDAFLEVLTKIDFDLLREYIGPSAWRMRATDKGFAGVSYLLSAEAD
jgi:hypothetical protein